MTPKIDKIICNLKKYNQSHIIKYLYNQQGDLNESLVTEIERINWTIFDKESLCNTDIVGIKPLPICTLSEISQKYEEYKVCGLNKIKQGKLGLVLLAGGEGTRLGFKGPKGTLNVGVKKELYLFELLIKQALKIVYESNSYIPFYIMTSPSNYKPTIDFFKEHNYFGYDSSCIHFFVQESNPVVDLDEKILLQSPNHLVFSPNGNGGWFSTMYSSGLIESTLDSQIEWLNVFSVDNALQGIADPIFLGATILNNCNCGSKVVKKVHPNEKVGVICSKNEKPYIIEYYEWETLIKSGITLDNSQFNYGVTLNYLFNVSDLVNTLSQRIPIHKVIKKVPYMDHKGEYIIPNKENAYKFETLVLDLIHMMDSCLPFEIQREKEFAPIKNKNGKDSLDTARELLIKNGYAL